MSDPALPPTWRLPEGVNASLWQYAHTMAASLVTMVPILAVFFAGQRYFIQGIVFTGVKG